MKRLSVILLVIMISMTSCAVNQEKNAEENKQSAFQPKSLDDDWSKWLVGEWQGSGESDAGNGKSWMKIELCLNGQFLIMKGETKITKITPRQKQYLKDVMHASEEDIEKFQSSAFKSLEIHTIDPKTGEIIGYLFDSMRCIAKGAGRREGNKEIMQWQWFAQGQGSSIRVTDKISADKFIITEKYTIPDGSIMEDKREMTRRR